MIRLKYLASIILFSATVSSQVRYSLDPYYILSKTENFSNTATIFNIAYPDTGVKNLHNYVQRNFMGNLGLPNPEYILRYKSAPLGFKLYDLPYSNDIITPQQVEYFRTKGPFASLTGIGGSKNEQTFRLLFSHTNKKRLNITVKFNRFGSTGFYQKQQAFTNNFYASLNYHSKSNRAGFYAYVLDNKIKNKENGGIRGEDSLFNPTKNKLLYPVNLSDARREIQMVDVNFNPWVKLNKGSDSSGLSHYADAKLNFNSNYYKYFDEGVEYDGFYVNKFIDTTATHDSTHLMQLTGQANYTIKSLKHGLGVTLGYNYEYNILHQFADSVFAHQMAGLNIAYKKLFLNSDSSTLNRNTSVSSNLLVNSVLAGPNQNDLKAEWIGNVLLNTNANGLATKRSVKLFANVLYEQRHPDFLYNYWYANSFQWKNDFKPVTLMQGRVGVNDHFTGLGFSVLYQSYTNYLYFDTVAAPVQFGKGLNNLALNFNFDKVFFKHLGVRANVIYQQAGDTNVVRIAPIVASGSLFYTGRLFKNNLQLQVGAQGQYYQGFRGYAYMPSTNIFYLQNRNSVGNYPFVDVFLNARIRPVQFFIKVENILQPFLGTSYFMVPHYPQPDLAFRFGLTWLFFD